MREFGERFNHNLHALYIVEHFEQRYLDFPGLNLTFEVREGIIKHSRDYTAAEHPELAEYLLDQRPPLEVDLVDEIVYNTADLDDGYEAHLIQLEQPGRRRHPLRPRLRRNRPALSRRQRKTKLLKQVLDNLPRT